MRERGRLAEQVEGVQRLERDVADALGLIELAEAEGDAATADAAVADLHALAAEAKRREIDSLLSGEADSNDAYLEVNAGAGGTEARTGPRCCCACMSAGPRSAATRSSDRAPPASRPASSRPPSRSPAQRLWLAQDRSGVHRLVRISPFDSGGAAAHQLRERLGLSR
jgi:peptide chain release factor 2